MWLDAIFAGFGLSMDAFAVSVSKGLTQKKVNIMNMLVIALFFGFFQFAMPVIGYFFCRQFAGFIESFDHWIAFILLVFIGAKMIFECLNENKEYKIKKQTEPKTEQENNTNQDTVSSQEKSKVTISNLQEEKNEVSILETKNLSDNNSIDNTSQESNKTIVSNTNINKTGNLQNSNKFNLNVKELFLLALATSIDALITGITFAFSNTNIFLTAGIIGIITFILSCVGFLIGNFFGGKFKRVAEIFGGVVLILLGIKFLLEGYGLINLGF